MRPRGTGCIYQQPNSPYWWIKYYRNGRAYRESAKTTEKRKAERFLAQRLAQVNTGNFIGPRVERILVEELAEDFLRDYRVNGRKSLEWAERRWQKHLKPFFGHLRAVQVSTELVNRYIEQRQQEGAENSTINRELAALKRMFSLGARSSPPKVYRVPAIPRLKESNVRSGFIEDEQYDKLKQACMEPWLRAILAVAYTYGWRKGEILGLRVRQVDLLDRSIRLNPGTTKNDQGRVVKMTDEVYELLRVCVTGKGPDDFVFTRRNGKPVRNFRKAWDSLCDRARIERVLIHDMRRSGVRNLIRSGVPERVAMAITGHKTRSVFDRYNIVNESDLADATRRLEERRNGHKTGILSHSEKTQETVEATPSVVQ